MFGLGIGSTVKLVALAAVAMVIGLGYLHYQGLVEDNARLRENVARLELAIEHQRSATEAALGAIEEWKVATEDLARRAEELARVQKEATTQSRKLNDLFAKHDLTKLSLRKPGLIERRINAGTDAAGRLLACTSTGRADCAD